MDHPVARMSLWERRPLSSGEIVLGRALFKGEIDWARVRLVQAPKRLGFGAMVPVGRTIVFARWRAARNFADAPLDEQGWLMHELMHVWQAARGVVLASAKLRALGKRAYAFKLTPGLKLAHYNIERQAEIARHLFMARSGAPEDESPPREWLEEIWASRLKGLRDAM
jgi:hypothetical protein